MIYTPFDAVVSSFAIDHLDKEDIPVALAEARRVLRPGGEFLLMVIVPNIWWTISFSPFVYVAFPGKGKWLAWLKSTGFVMKSTGTSQACTWFLVEKRK